MKNVLRVCGLNVADTATVTATTADASYPATNLQLPGRSDRFRTTDASSNRKIYLTWGSSQRVNFVALARHNLTGSATWRVQTYSGASWTTQLTDSGSVAPFDATLLGRLASAEGVYSSVLRGIKTAVAYNTLQTTVRSIEITLNDTGNADGYLEAARLYVGEYLPLDRTAAYGASVAWEEVARQERLDDGTLRTLSVVPPFRRWRLAMQGFSDADRALLSDLMLGAGARKDLFLSLYPGDGTFLEIEGQGIVKMPSLGAFAHLLPAHHSTELQFVEA